jgi:thymidylate kinase
VRQDLRIIVEGMDGAGKTTLIEYLKDEFHNLEIIVNEKGPDQDFNSWWPAQLERDKSPIVPIHDRFFYSELVYGPVLRGHMAADSVIIENVRWFLRHTSLLIYARPQASDLRESVKTKNQMKGVHDKFDDLLREYDHLMEVEASWFGKRFVQYSFNRNRERQRIAAFVEQYLGEG